MLSPSLLKGLQNAAKAARKVTEAAVKGEKVLVSPKVKKERLKTCRACPLLLEKGELSSCSMCKCNVGLKTRLATEKCPKGKWAE